MASWALTPGLQNLRAQVNAAFPERDKTSDGTISDAAHWAESSTDHSPDDTPGSNPGWDGDPDHQPDVRAWDMDSDLRAAPATAQQVVDHIRKLPGVSAVLRYMIYNRKIYKASNDWYPEVYTGASAHTEHVHFSGQRTEAADDNTSFNYRLEEIPVALTAADKSWIAEQIRAPYTDTDKTSLSETEAGHDVLSQQIPDGTRPGSPQTAAWMVIQHLGQALVALQKTVDELAAKP